MSKSLQDQLLALGLAQAPSAGQVAGTSRDRAAKSNRPDKSRAKQKKKAPAGPASKPATAELTLEQAYLLREQYTKERAAQAREQKRLEDLRRRQINEAIRAIVEPHRLNDAAAELSRNFMYKGRIRKVNVTAEQLKALNEGRLGLVYLAGGYHVLSPEHVAQVLTLSEEHVPDLSGGADEDEQFPVPDDLVW
jgi:uncharacterized protein YaiL (DUF2058 family)